MRSSMISTIVVVSHVYWLTKIIKNWLDAECLTNINYSLVFDLCAIQDVSDCLFIIASFACEKCARPLLVAQCALEFLRPLKSELAGIPLRHGRPREPENSGK